jgi:hypothetical protein
LALLPWFLLQNRSLTQNTDRSVLANIPYLFLCEHLIFKVIRLRFRAIGALPSSAHTYRLLIVKELVSVLRLGLHRSLR